MVLPLIDCVWFWVWKGDKKKVCVCVWKGNTSCCLYDGILPPLTLFVSLEQSNHTHAPTHTRTYTHTHFSWIPQSITRQIYHQHALSLYTCVVHHIICSIWTVKGQVCVCVFIVLEKEMHKGRCTQNMLFPLHCSTFPLFFSVNIGARIL